MGEVHQFEPRQSPAGDFDLVQWAHAHVASKASRPAIEDYVETYRAGGMAEAEIAIRVNAITSERERSDRLASTICERARAQEI